MTIIKQRAVTEKGHQRNLRAYINDDRKVLLRDSQNMEECADLKRWASYMEATRKTFGHDKAARRIRDKKTGELKQAKNTIMYHQILGFNPDECDINGGKLSPEDCMRYAKEYAEKFYPNQEVVFALHNEYCKEDKTHRYAVHMVINRSDLSNGKRLAEGLSKTAIQNDFHNGVHSLFPEITDAFFKGQPLDVDGLSILMPPKTAPENIVKGVQVPTDLPVQTEGKYPLHLVIKTGHVRKAAAVDGEHLSHIHINGSFKWYFSMILFSKAS